MNNPNDTGRADRGATLLIAVAALALAGMLGAVALANARTELRHSDRLVERSVSDGLTELAVADAWSSIVGGAATSFVGEGETDGGTWSYVARVVDPDRWEIETTAIADQTETNGTIAVAREPLMPYTLRVGTVSTAPLTGRVSGRVAVLDRATFVGQALGDTQELIGGAECTGCTNAVEVGDGQPFRAPLPATGLTAAPCPDVGGTVTGFVPGGFVYGCTDPSLVFAGAIGTDGPVLFELGPDVVLSLEDAAVNVGGDPSAFVVSSTAGSSTLHTSRDSVFHGVLALPDSQLATDGLDWVGLVVADDLDPVSGSRLVGDWDPSLASYGFDSWRIVQWNITRN